MSLEQRVEGVLRENGWFLPEVYEPPASFQLGTSAAGLLLLAGTMSFEHGGPTYVGKVGRDISTLEAEQASQAAALQVLANIRHILGSLDEIVQVARLTVYVNATEDYTEHFRVADAASEVFLKTLGRNGRHSRTSIGVSGLSYQTPVELDVVIEPQTDRRRVS